MPVKNDTSVGRSKSRTPIKHQAFNSLLGMIVGAASTGKTATNGVVVVVDLFAGDGQPSEESTTSSPAIIAKHLQFEKLHPLSRAYLFELQETTFNVLHSRYGDNEKLTLINADSSIFDTRDTWYGIDARDAVVIHADPNCIAHLNIDLLLNNFPVFGTFMITMGCNVGGLKRKPEKEREEWYRIKALAESMRNHHDCIMVILDKDASQWCYMIILPKAWSDRYVRTLSNNKLAKGKITIYQYSRTDDATWGAVFDRQFLTKDELEAKRHV